MPPTKKRSSRKAKAFLEQDKYTAELTSVQLVSGVCILLIFGLFCFLGGILVGKFEGGPRIQSADRSPVQITLPNLIPDETYEADPGLTRNTESRPIASPPARQVTRSVEKTQPIPEGHQTSPRTVELPTPPSKRTPVARRDESKAPPAPSNSKPPEPTSTTQKSAPSPTREVKPGTEKVAQEAAKGSYTVQIGAYGNRRLADEMKKKVENGSAYQVQLFDPGNGKYVIVYVGRFADRALAVVARDELRKAFGVADCFVKKLTS